MKIEIEFKNESMTEVSIIIEPAADQFLLKSKDKIKLLCESLEDISTIQSTLVDKETIVIWLPRGSFKWSYYINGCIAEPL